MATTEEKLETALLLIMDSVDYRNGAASPTEMIAACLPVVVLETADKAIEAVRKERAVKAEVKP